jgi:phospholipid/cholesterol/gamma-HCH transport system substrate-binding protein
MKKVSIETAVGVFVLIGLISVAYLTIKLGKMEWFGDNYYMVDARFDSVSGLKRGAQVDMAGVEIGQVADIRLDNERQVAIVRMKIEKDVTLTDDVIASVKTSGLIGDKYIQLTPGGSDRILEAGDTIIETESALDIEALVSKYVFGDAK